MPFDHYHCSEFLFCTPVLTTGERSSNLGNCHQQDRCCIHHFMSCYVLVSMICICADFQVVECFSEIPQ